MDAVDRTIKLQAQLPTKIVIQWNLKLTEQHRVTHGIVQLCFHFTHSTCSH
jgi:hypothetical protein